LTANAYLSGAKVADFSMFTPGPFASQILADLGATVLKIERPKVGDLERVTVPAYFAAYNRGKASIELDLKRPEAIEAARELVREADILLDGFRPGVMERLGLGFAALSAINPRLIYISLNGLGSWGPLAQQRGHDSDYMARIGALGVTPRPGGVPMYDLPMPISDYAAGMYAVIAALGEYGRQPRRAVHVEVPVMAAGLAWMFPKIVRELEAESAGAVHRELPAVGCFRTADDRYVTVTAVEDHVFADLCAAMGAPDMAADPRFGDMAGRREHAAEINARISAFVGTLNFKECLDLMDRHGAPCAPVNRPSEVFDDPQVASLEMLHREPSLHADLPIFGIERLRRVRPPGLGEDSEHVAAHGWDGLAERLEKR